MGQPLQTLALGSENKLNYEHLRIFLIHTGNKIALQFHKINVPVYIYRKPTVHTLREALEEQVIEREREIVRDQNRKTSQKPYRHYSAQLSRHNCTSKRVTAQCWGQEGPKSSTFTIESSGTNRVFTVKSIAGKQTDALLSECSRTSIAQKLVFVCVFVDRELPLPSFDWLLNLCLKAPVELPLLIVHLTQNHVVF